jgi:predicted translin family RNA/ssDNA-binding protein
MWWNDIKEIKEWMITIASRLTALDVNVDIIKQEQEDADCFSDSLEKMEEKIDKIRDEFPRFEKLVNPDELVSTYEKHIIKIEQMMLEFKGCVSMARSSIAERKELDAELKDMKNVAHIAQNIYNSMLNFIKSGDNLESRNYFKLDAIYRAICEKSEKKPKKKGKTVKKTVIPPSP